MFIYSSVNCFLSAFGVKAQEQAPHKRPLRGSLPSAYSQYDRETDGQTDKGRQEYEGLGGPREKGSHLTKPEDFRKTFTSLELNLKRRINAFHSFIRCLFSIYYVLSPVGCWD